MPKTALCYHFLHFWETSMLRLFNFRSLAAVLVLLALTASFARIVVIHSPGELLIWAGLALRQVRQKVPLHALGVGFQSRKKAEGFNSLVHRHAAAVQRAASCFPCFALMHAWRPRR
jgi:hypothetical protein